MGGYMKIPTCFPIKIDTSSITSICEDVRGYSNARGFASVEKALGCHGIQCEECIADDGDCRCILQRDDGVTKEFILKWLIRNRDLWYEEV